jgi:hypothetical protein
VVTKAHYPLAERVIGSGLYCAPARPSARHLVSP